MGKKVLFCVGVGITLLGLYGVVKAIRAYGEPPRERADLETIGTIYELEGEDLKLRLTGTTISSSFKLKYEFVAENGKQYLGWETINEHQFRGLREGGTVTVQYHSSNPNISAAKGYGTYISVAELPDYSPKQRLYGCFGITGFGVFVVAAALFIKDEEPPSTEPAAAEKFSDDPMESLHRWRQEQQLLA